MAAYLGLKNGKVSVKLADPCFKCQRLWGEHYSWCIIGWLQRAEVDFRTTPKSPVHTLPLQRGNEETGGVESGRCELLTEE